MRNRAWVVFAVLAAASLRRVLHPGRPAGQAAALLPRRVSRPRLAIVLGVRLHRPAERRAWLLVAAGLACFATGDVVFYGYEVLTGEAAPFPYWSDVLYLGCYVFLMAGPLRLVSAMCGRDRSSIVDAAIVTTGVGLPLWVFFIAPYASTPAARCSPAPSPSPTRSPTSACWPSWPGCGSRRSAARSP